jgi:hypothetical protein
MASLMAEAYGLRGRANDQAADQAPLNHVLHMHHAVRVAPPDSLQVMFATTPEDTRRRLNVSRAELFATPVAHFCGFGLGKTGRYPRHDGGEGGDSSGGGGDGDGEGGDGTVVSKASYMAEWYRELRSFRERGGR